MHLKAAVVSLLMLSSFIIQSSSLSVETRSIDTDASPAAVVPSITVGPYLLFASASRFDPTYAFNVESSQTAVFDLTMSDHFAYTVVNDELLVYGGGRSVEKTFQIFNVTSQQKSEVSYGGDWNFGNQFVSFGNKVMIVGGAAYDSEDFYDYYCRIYDVTTQAMTNCTLPSPSYFKRSAVVGQYAVFAGGLNRSLDGGSPVSTALVFNSATQTWTTTTIHVAGDDVQSVSIGRFAIFVAGNTADIFDSNTQSWTTHTLSQNPSSSERGYSIAKTSRYAFFVGIGVADVFDSQTQTWSTLDIDPSTEARYCPSTTVDDYAVFACYYKIMVYNTITKEFVQNFTVLSERIEYLLQAGSVGKVATFFYGTLYNPYLRIIDFTGFPPAVPPSTPVAPVPVSTPSSPSTPTTVPWSPWTAPVSSTPSANYQPTTTNAPSTTNSPTTTYQPSTSTTPVSDNNSSPTVSSSPSSSSSSPLSSSSPTSGNPSQVTVGAPENKINHEATSSSSVISVTAFLSVFLVVCLLV